MTHYDVIIILVKRKSRTPTKEEEIDPDFDEEDEYEPICESWSMTSSIIMTHNQ